MHVLIPINFPLQSQYILLKNSKNRIKVRLGTDRGTDKDETELNTGYSFQIKLQATTGFQTFITHYREDPDQQNLIDWIQEDWVIL